MKCAHILDEYMSIVFVYIEYNPVEKHCCTISKAVIKKEME